MENDRLSSHIDPARLVRASKVEVYSVDANGDSMPPFHYRSRGSEGDYYLYTVPHLSCDCPDFTIRGSVCKHLIKALALEEDPQVMGLVRQYGLAPFFQLWSSK